MKPILFNTEMVRAILEGRKMVTRRVVKPQCDVLIKIENGGVFYAESFGKWCSVEGNPRLAKQRLYGRDGRSYLLSNEICRILPEGVYGLVSTKGTSGEDGISFDFDMSPKQEKDDECSQPYLRGISRRMTRLCSSTSHGRESIEQCSREFSVGDRSGKLERQKGTQHGDSWGETSDVKTDRCTKIGNIESIFPRNEPEEDSSALFRKSICNLEHIKIPFSVGQTLYVRETWAVQENLWNGTDFVNYRANCNYTYAASIKWRPSIHMPRKYARIFLRVTDVRVERLRNITELDILEKEGVTVDFPQPKPSYMSLAYTETRLKPAVKKAFSDLWDSTIKPAYRALYGWDANPWVWVTEFERISREEAERNV